jgi:hypothetical protein
LQKDRNLESVERAKTQCGIMLDGEHHRAKPTESGCRSEVLLLVFETEIYQKINSEFKKDCIPMFE